MIFPRSRAGALGLAVLSGVALAAAPACALAAKLKAPAVYTVTIRQMRFSASPAGLQVGDSVEWVNNDIFVHSATAKDRSFDIELKPKAHVRMALTKAGLLAFACRYHPGMTGTLAVAK